MNKIYRGTNAGGNSEEVTPVPIPNTAVKLFRVDGTYPARDWKSRSLPALVPLMAFVKLRHVCFFLTMFVGIIDQDVQASPLSSTANLLDGKSWSIAISGQHVEREPVFEITGTDAIQVSLASGSNTIFSDVNADVETDQTSDAAVAVLNVRPREGLQYSIRLGQVHKYELEISSGAHVNVLESLNDGFLWGIGVGGLITPGSIVSTAISWRLDFARTVVQLDRFSSPGVVHSANIRLEEEEIQGAVNFSRRWKNFEPYGGLKIMRLTTRLKDKDLNGKVSGTTEGFSPYVGLQWWVAERERVVLEASGVDEKSYSAAIQVQF